MQLVLFSEPGSGLSARCRLMSEAAPRSADFLWRLALHRPKFEAIHAIWTGPELSCPLAASVLPEELAAQVVPEENATSFPAEGDIVLASIAAGAIQGTPPGNFFDIGLFYGPGGRLLMPFGLIRANVCAKVLPEDLENFRNSIAAIRKNGSCMLGIEPVET